MRRRTAPRALCRAGGSDRRGNGQCRLMTEFGRSKLPDVGTTIFTVMSRRARELGALNLGQGFPDYDIDPRIGELLAQAVSEGHNQYAPMEGSLLLRQVISAKLKATYGIERDWESEVTVTLG